MSEQNPPAEAHLTSEHVKSSDLAFSCNDGAVTVNFVEKENDSEPGVVSKFTVTSDHPETASFGSNGVTIALEVSSQFPLDKNRRQEIAAGVATLATKAAATRSYTNM